MHNRERFFEAEFNEAIFFLQKLISIESYSKTENESADAIDFFFKQKKISTYRHLNNVWCRNKYFDVEKKTILLNTHHDTVKANMAYTKNPFEGKIIDDKIFGLGSTDAGASLVSLVQCFLYFYEKQNLKYNLIIALTAEEEISGKDGIESILPFLPISIAYAIVGEPTQMDLAIAEKGLMVVDCEVMGEAGHAARDEGVNAIYIALKDIEWIKNYEFEKTSYLLHKNKMSVNFINAGLLHNVVPASCRYTIDVRLNELYSHEEVLEILNKNIQAKMLVRSFRLKSSVIDTNHEIVVAGKKLGKKIYGSPTTSDKALMPFPALKCGPGFSAQSHTADEFVLLDDVYSGIEMYIKMLEMVLHPL